MDLKNNFNYYAFISYNRKDIKWAKWLQNKLENYKVPNHLLDKLNSPSQKYMRPIFRDKTDIGIGELDNNISAEISESKFLIVICSPNAVKSPWVNKEILKFKDISGEHKIIPFIIEGTPNSENDKQCYPSELSKNILGASIIELTKEQAFIKVVSFILNVRYDDLWKRHEKKLALKRNISLLIVSLIIVISFLTYKYTIKQEINTFLSDCELNELHNTDTEKIVTLNINKYKSNKLPNTLKYFQNVEMLNMSLKGLPSDYKFNEIENLKYLTKLRKLSLEHCDTKTIKILLKLPNLEELSLSWCNKIEDWNILSKLKKLKKIHIINCNLDRIAYLKNLTNISELELSGNKSETGLDSLKYLKNNLRKLTLWNSSIKYINPICKLENLEELDLTNSFFLNGFCSFPKLKKLVLANSGIEFIDGIDVQFSLKYLDISGAEKINNYDDVKKIIYRLKNLDTLIISHNLYNSENENFNKINTKLIILDDFQ